MPVVHRLYREPRRASVQKVTAQLKAYPGVKPRLAFPFSISPQRRRALELVKYRTRVPAADILAMLQSTDFVEREAAIQFMRNIKPGKVPPKIMDALVQMTREHTMLNQPYMMEALVRTGKLGERQLYRLAKDPHWVVRAHVAEVAGEIGNKELIRQLIDDPDRMVRDQAINSAARTGQVELLKRAAKDPEYRYNVAWAARGLGSRGVEILDMLIDDPDSRVRHEVAFSARRIGKKGIPILKKLAHDPSPWVNGEVEEAAISLGRAGIPVLKERANGQEYNKRMHLEGTIRRIRQGKLPEKPRDYEQTENRWFFNGEEKRWLLGTQKPFLAHGVRPSMERARVLQYLSDQLKEEFGDKFIGITVFGSTSKGYAWKESDVDLAVVATNQSDAMTISARLKDLATTTGVMPCNGPGLHRLSKERLDTHPETESEHLFHGMFFGDHRRLLQLQKKVVDGLSEKEWDEVRKKIYDHETNVLKGVQRFGINGYPLTGLTKEDYLEQASSLLRVPPPLDEMRRIMARRARQMHVR